MNYTIGSFKITLTVDETVVLTAMLLHKQCGLKPARDVNDNIRGDMLVHDYMHLIYKIGVSEQEENRLSTYESYCWDRTLPRPAGLTNEFIQDHINLRNYSEYKRIYEKLVK